MLYISTLCVLVMLQIPRNLTFIKDKCYSWIPPFIGLLCRAVSVGTLRAKNQNLSHVQVMLLSWRRQRQCPGNCCCLIFFSIFHTRTLNWAQSHNQLTSLLSKGKNPAPFSKERVSFTRNLLLKLSVSLRNENLQQDAGKCDLLYHPNSIGLVT